jgi:hypothetical protein
VNRSFVGQVSQFRVTWLAIGLLIGTLLVASATVIVAPRLGELFGAENAATREHPGYGTGYPQHGGLAGPSTVTGDQRTGYGTGYPQHGGLAGPSTADSPR